MFLRRRCSSRWLPRGVQPPRRLRTDLPATGFQIQYFNILANADRDFCLQCDIWPPPYLGGSVQPKTHSLCQPSITREYLLQHDITKLRHWIAPTTSSVTLVIGPSWSCHAVRESFRVVQSYTKLCSSGVLTALQRRAEMQSNAESAVHCQAVHPCPPDPILRSNVHWPLPPHRIARYTVQC